MYSTLNEIPVFLGCLYAGILIGIVYDLLRLLCFPFRSRVLSEVADGLFYCLACCIAAFALLVLNDGRVRFYALCGLLLGAFLYLRFPSRLFRGMLRALGVFLHRIFPARQPRPKEALLKDL